MFRFRLLDKSTQHAPAEDVISETTTCSRIDPKADGEFVQVRVRRGTSQLLSSRLILSWFILFTRRLFFQDDERTSEYGSDNNSEFGVQNFEELLASAVIRQVALTTTTTPHTADGHSTVT